MTSRPILFILNLKKTNRRFHVKEKMKILKQLIFSQCINNPNITNSFQSLSHRHLVGDLSTFYRSFYGHCSQEISVFFPVPLRHVRTTRSSTHSHPFQVSLPIPQTPVHKSSFIPRTCNLWNVLLSSYFPESYNLPSFKSKINKLDLISVFP